MIEGASQADFAILIISARRGEFETGKNLSLISSSPKPLSMRFHLTLFLKALKREVKQENTLHW